MRILVPACIALAALSLLAPSAPTTDPWGWIVWGREVASLRLDTAVGGVPSWKPLPVLFTTVLSIFGDAAPALWLVVARAAGLLAVALAYRLGARLAGRAAGAVAAVGLLSVPGFLRGIAHGYSEALVAALVLWAVERHLGGHRRQALALGFLATLGRPEAYPLLAGYAALLWLRPPRARLMAGAVLAVSPLLWLGGDLWGSGDPFHAGAVARVNLEPAAGPPWLEALAGAARVAGLPILLLAAAGVAAAIRGRDRATLAPAAVGSGWVAAVALMAAAGYPALGRFVIPAVALLCVVAGAGAIRLVGAARSPPARVAVAAALMAAIAPVAFSRMEFVSWELAETRARAELQAGLPGAVSRAGGADGVLAHGQVVLPEGYGWNRGALAWALDVPLDEVRGVRLLPGTSLRRLRPATAALGRPVIAERHVVPAGSCGRPGCVLFLPLGGRPPMPARRSRLTVRRLADSGEWRVFALSRRQPEREPRRKLP